MQPSMTWAERRSASWTSCGAHKGNACGAFGLDPSECAYRVVASGSYWRLRDYGGDESFASLTAEAVVLTSLHPEALTPTTDYP